jgi:3',5'-cyclic AMP phosphodiesterase CpdA
MPCFIHLTDTHLVAPGQRLYGLDPIERLELAVADIARRHGPGSALPASFAVITGDLTHYGDPESYQALGAALDRLPFPAHLLIGNHDDRAGFRAAFPAAAVDAAGFVQWALDADGMRLIALDTHTPAGHHGELCQTRLAWLAARLAEGNAPVLLFLHHAPLPVGIVAMDTLVLRQADALWDVLAPHRARLRHIFFGHLHRPISGSWRGIPLSTLRGTAHQVALDFLPRTNVPGSHEPPAYAVVLADAANLVIHSHDYLDRSGTFIL